MPATTPTHRLVRTYFVEDNVTIRENLIETLHELTPVHVAGWSDNAAEAIVWLTQNAASWDLAIIDLFLKQGNGLDVLKHCSSHSASQKKVVLTNHANETVRHRALTLGAHAVFDKTQDIDALIDFCRNLQA